MNSHFTVLACIKDEPLRIIPLLENFEGMAKVIVLLDPKDSLTESILIEKSIAYIKRPENFEGLSQAERTAWILNQSPTKYVLIAHASFFVPIKLMTLFEKVAKDGDYDAVFNAMNYWSHGKLVQELWIRKRSSACYFFNRDKVNIDAAAIHDEFPINRKNNCFMAPPNKEHSIQVFRDDDMSVVTLKEVAYAEIEAKERLTKDGLVTLRFLIFKIVKSFLAGYLRMGGFRFGIEGFIFHANHAIQQFLVYSRLWELQNKKYFNENRELHVKMRDKFITNDRKNIRRLLE